MGLHCTSLGFAREIYLPYICHVPNCITRYVGFLYKTALRSHRLRCHRSICRRAPLSSPFSLSLALTLHHPSIHAPASSLSSTSLLVSLFSMPHTRTHTEKYFALHSRTIWLAALPFIHNTPGSRSSTLRSGGPEHILGQSGAKCPSSRGGSFYGRREFSEMSCRVERSVRTVRPVRLRLWKGSVLIRNARAKEKE